MRPLARAGRRATSACLTSSFRRNACGLCDPGSWPSSPNSMKAQGQLQPIVLRPSEATGYYLVAGMHRLAAAKTLPWESIWATVLEGLNADRAALAEIDENLARADLSPAERAAHQHARKELYERLHPQTRKGSAGGRAKSAKSQGAKYQVDTWHPAYIDDAAKKSGRSRASISREANRGKSIPDVADLAGTSLDKGTELDALGRLPADVREQLAAEAKAGKKVSAKATLKKVQRAQKEIDLGFKQAALPQKRYGVIVADPEWCFEPWSQETGMDRAADNHYPTSPTEIIAGRPVASIAADDCVLFLWATVPMLPQALRVMAAWGFEYKTNFIWAKDRIGTGYWNRNKHEHLLVGVRGKPPAPAPGTQWESVLHAPVGRHSDGGSDEIGAVRVKALLNQEVHLTEVDVTEVDGDLFAIAHLGSKLAHAAHFNHPTTIRLDGIWPVLLLLQVPPQAPPVASASRFLFSHPDFGVLKGYIAALTVLEIRVSSRRCLRMCNVTLQPGRRIMVEQDARLITSR